MLRSRVRFILIFGLLHAVVSTGSFIVAFGRSMGRFDTGEEAGLVEMGLRAMSEFLLFPLTTLLYSLSKGSQFFPGLLGYIPIVANSLL